MAHGTAQSQVRLFDANGLPLLKDDFLVGSEELTRIRRIMEEREIARAEADPWEPPRGSLKKVQSMAVAIASDQIVPVSFDNYNAVPSSAYAVVKSCFQSYGIGVSGTTQNIRATPYTEPTTAVQRSVSSASAADTAAGTGAQQIAITYLDGLWKRRVDVVTMAGAGVVATNASDIQYVESVQVTRVGSGLRNAGVITLFVNNAGGGGTIGTIGVGSLVAAVGDNETKWGHHYVPANKIGRICNQVMGTSGSLNNGYMFLRSKRLDLTGAAELDIGSLALVSVPFTVVDMSSAPIVVQGPAVINMYCIPSANSIGVFASFDCVEL